MIEIRNQTYSNHYYGTRINIVNIIEENHISKKEDWDEAVLFVVQRMFTEGDSACLI